MKDDIKQITTIISHIIDKTCLYTYCFECPLNNDGKGQNCDLNTLIEVKNNILNKLGE